MVETLGLIAAVALPLWNIPLIVRIAQRQSSRDVSLWWVIGVWVCLVLMCPAGLRSPDRVFRAFTIINTVLFTAVVVQVVRYHHHG